MFLQKGYVLNIACCNPHQVVLNTRCCLILSGLNCLVWGMQVQSTPYQIVFNYLFPWIFICFLSLKVDYSMTLSDTNQLVLGYQKEITFFKDNYSNSSFLIRYTKHSSVRMSFSDTGLNKIGFIRWKAVGGGALLSSKWSMAPGTLNLHFLITSMTLSDEFCQCGTRIFKAHNT